MTALDACHVLWAASIATPTDLKTIAARDIAGALNLLLADIFALYLKTKGGHLCEQRSDHYANRCEMNVAHDMSPHSHLRRRNIDVAINLVFIRPPTKEIDHEYDRQA